MKAALKFGFTALGLFLIALGIGGIVVYTQAEKFASRSLSEILTESFAAEAQVEKISIAPTQKAVILHNVSLKNPANFKEGDAFTSRRVILRMDLLSLLSRTPVIDQVTFMDSEIAYRYEIAEGTNIGTLSRKLEEFAELNPVPVKFVINKVRCRDANVTFSSNLIPRTEMDMSMVTVELDELNDGKPVSTSKAASIFLKGIMRETLTLNGLLDPVAKLLRKETEDDLEESLQQDIDAEKARESN